MYVYQSLQNIHLVGAWCILRGLQTQLNWTHTTASTGDKPGALPAFSTPAGAGLAGGKTQGTGGKTEGSAGLKAGKETKDGAGVTRSASTKR